jgi:hypothetical protein
MFPLQRRQCLPETGKNAARFVDLPEPGFGNSEVTLGFATAFGRGIAEERSDEFFPFQPIQCGVDATDRDSAATVAFEFTRDGNAVRIFAEMDNGKEDHHFEFAEVTTFRHYFNNSEEIDESRDENDFLDQLGWLGAVAPAVASAIRAI